MSGCSTFENAFFLLIDGKLYILKKLTEDHRGKSKIRR